VDDLLTTKQLQDLIQVDRVTIYRMLNDGRLRGFKVGGQWRFPRREIEQWLSSQGAAPEAVHAPLTAEDDLVPSPQALPLSCIRAIQDVYAEALDIAAVTTDLEGGPLIGVSNSCAFCNLVLGTPLGRQRCAAAWRQMSNGQVYPCHAGLLCVSSTIVVVGRPVAITAGCQFRTKLPEGLDDSWMSSLPALSAELGLDDAELWAAAGTVRVMAPERLPRVSHLLQRVVDTFSEIGEERLSLLSRLQHIAEISKIQ
jgi:excisionase family DNA binding protein